MRMLKNGKSLMKSPCSSVLPVLLSTQPSATCLPPRLPLLVVLDRPLLKKLPTMIPILVNIRTTIIGKRVHVDLAHFAPKGGDAEKARKGIRRAWFDGAWHEAQVYDRAQLPLGHVFHGPAIVEQDDTTILSRMRASQTLHARAVLAAHPTFATEIDGRHWEQASFPYQLKCLKEIRREFASMATQYQTDARTLLNDAGLSPLIDVPIDHA